MREKLKTKKEGSTKDNKGKYTDKQKRMAGHIEESFHGKGMPKDEAEARAWATVNKETGGGRHPGGSGRGMGDKEEKIRRSEAAKRGWETRRKG